MYRKCVDSRKKTTTALVDDGYAWRKYGQKQILHANHPRYYVIKIVIYFIYIFFYLIFSVQTKDTNFDS